MSAAANTVQDPATKQALQAAAQKIYDKLNAVVADKYGGPISNAEKVGPMTDTTYVGPSLWIGRWGGRLPGQGVYAQPERSPKPHHDGHHSESPAESQLIGSELSMMNLQSLMSQRQEAIQTCTNLVQAMGDMCSKITENNGK